ncbi:MAG: hypothetical protein M1818_007137 [Claussenomyces sp. TS43310]|nr:MAG: hypothetical protein M1818_007137 [Claussenomyces sp. TS43310]
MRFTNALLFLGSFARWAFADITFTTPAAGTTLTAGTALTVTLATSGTPAIGDLSSYTLTLYTGSNTTPVPLTTLKPGGTTFTTTSISVTIDPGVGGNVANAYFLGINSVATAGGNIINYSSRFTISGMTGSFTPAVTASLATVSGTEGPPAVNQLAAAGAATSAEAVGTAGLFGTPYTAQVGLTRYASMQPLPPTKITASNTAPQYPTSPFTIATTFLPIPSIVTTITQQATYSFSSRPNTAAAASQPTDAMQRFLNRWKD